MMELNPVFIVFMYAFYELVNTSDVPQLNGKCRQLKKTFNFLFNS